MGTGDIELWGRASSCNVQKAWWALEEAGVSYERIDAGGNFGGLREPDYLAMNPTGRVPTLRDGKLVVWESDAIIRYVAARYGAGDLWPEDPAARAVCDQWMCWSAAHLYGSWIGLFWNTVRMPREEQKPRLIENLRRVTARNYALLDQRLGQSSYLAGASFTMADIPAGMTLYRWFEMPIQRPTLPNLESWYARLRERPAYRKAVCVPYDDLVGKKNF